MISYLFKLFGNLIIWKAKRTPYTHLTGYMNRYWLVPFAPDNKTSEQSAKAQGLFRAKVWRNPVIWLCQKLSISIRVHQILSSDKIELYHDHPTHSIIWILRGCYLEHTPSYNVNNQHTGDSVKQWNAGSIRCLSKTDKHRLTLADNTDVWSLFIQFGKKHRWGFYEHLESKIIYADYFKSNPDKSLQTGRVKQKAFSIAHNVFQTKDSLNHILVYETELERASIVKALVSRCEPEKVTIISNIDLAPENQQALAWVINRWSHKLKFYAGNVLVIPKSLVLTWDYALDVSVYNIHTYFMCDCYPEVETLIVNNMYAVATKKLDD